MSVDNNPVLLWFLRQGLKNLTPLCRPIRGNTKPIVTRSETFSRASCRLPVCAPRFDWLTGLWVPCDWPERLLWVRFYDTRWKSVLLSADWTIGDKSACSWADMFLFFPLNFLKCTKEISLISPIHTWRIHGQDRTTHLCNSFSVDLKYFCKASNSISFSRCVSMAWLALLSACSNLSVFSTLSSMSKSNSVFVQRPC